MIRYTLRRLGLMVVTSTLLLLIAPVSAQEEGEVLRVGPEQEYAAIQDAVDVADPGDQILVYPGFYFETVTVRTNDLKILAQSSGVEMAADTDIACFDVKADYVEIRGFDMTGPMLASGIRFEGSHNTFADNTIHDLAGLGVNALSCRDWDGGSDYNAIINNTISQANIGIVVQAGRDDMPYAVNRGNIIQGNFVSEVDQAPIAVENGIGFLVSDNRIDGSPGGHCLLIGSPLLSKVAQGHHRIVRNVISGCSLSGIYVYATDAIVEANEIAHNEVSAMGECGVLLEGEPGAPVWENVIRSNNTWDNKTGGICVGSGANYNTVYANQASDNRWADNAHGVVVQGDSNLIVGNTARENDGSGIIVVGDNNRITENTALGNDIDDLADRGTDNEWWANTFETASWVTLQRLLLPALRR